MKIVKSVFAAVILLTGLSVQAESGVARAIFATDIQDREPVDQVGQLTNDHSLVYFFTEIRGLEGQTITHRWEQGGEVRAEVNFNVGGNRWRVWSSKNLQPGWLGEWKVSVVDAGGNVLSQESFAYVPAGQESSAPAEPEQQESEPVEEEADSAAAAE
ncbi:MAG: DUF2914 domain-containing protein [Gammaproteobacteria bacterium]|nr:DUF2914 domain-containing protein [Gammaproteobacteria bacterium]